MDLHTKRLALGEKAISAPGSHQSKHMTHQKIIKFPKRGPSRSPGRSVLANPYKKKTIEESFLTTLRYAVPLLFLLVKLSDSWVFPFPLSIAYWTIPSMQSQLTMSGCSGTHHIDMGNGKNQLSIYSYISKRNNRIKAQYGVKRGGSQASLFQREYIVLCLIIKRRFSKLSFTTTANYGWNHTCSFCGCF